MFKLLQQLIKKTSLRLDSLNVISIYRDCIVNNFNVYKTHSEYIFPVLKSNAYGHGIEQIATILNDIETPYVTVDSYYEYLKIKKITRHKVLIMGYNPLSNLRLFNYKKIAILVNDIPTLKVLASLDTQITIHLKFNTGMNRQGLEFENIPQIMDLCKKRNITIEGVATHLACADSDERIVQEQYAKFDEIIREIKKRGVHVKYIHVSNSAGSRFNKKEYNTIRLGLGLYGYFTGKENEITSKLLPGLEFKSTIINVRNIKKGEHIGYDYTYTAPCDMIIGVVPVGYYEGVDRSLSNNGYMTVRGVKCPIVGRVSMNISTIDITRANAVMGDDILFISKDKNAENSVVNIASNTNTIPYVVTTKLSESIRRKIV